MPDPLKSLKSLKPASAKVAFEPVLDADGETDFIVGLGTMARWANRSDERVLQLRREGIVVADARGRYRLRENLRRIDEHRSEKEKQATKSAADGRIRDARARQIELSIAREERELVPLADSIAAIDCFAGAIVTRLESLPARITHDLELRERITNEVDDIRQVVADQMARQAAELRGDTLGSSATNRAARRAAHARSR